MSDFDLVTPDQLDELRRLIRSGVDPAMCELVAVRWPSGTVQYGFAQFDLMSTFRQGLEARGLTVDVRKTSGYFLDLNLRSEIEDDSVSIELADHDRAITSLIQTHGTGHQVEIYYYFPQVDAYVSVWSGHLRPPQEGGKPTLVCTANAGFRNVNVLLPRRVLFTGTCQAYFGGRLKTLAEVLENDCPYGAQHGGFGLMDPATGLPFTSCPRNSRAACTARLGDALSFLTADTVVESVNNYSGGQNLLAWSKGNETNLKDPVRVQFGTRWVRDLQPCVYSKQFNSEHQDQGFFRAVFPVGEGLLKSMTQCSVQDVLVGLEHLNVRLGALRQPPTNFSENVSNMSGTGHFFAVHGQVDPSQLNASNVRGKCLVEGQANVRIYSDEVTFSQDWTDKRAWCLLHMELNRRWGRGKNMSRFYIPDWIALAEWGDQMVKYKTADGVEHTIRRTSYNAELVGRVTGDQIKDVCLFGRFGLPFRHNGKTRIVPLQKEGIDDKIPVFTDEGPDANIVITNEGSQIFWSQIDLAELTNQLEVRFEDAAHDNIERPMTFSDQEAQERAAEALGDTGVHIVPKPYSMSGPGGVTLEGEAIRTSWMLLMLGEFDGGGIRNNLRVRLLTNVFETLNLRRYQLIKIVSQKIEGFKQRDGQPFLYFRVMDRQRKSDLFAEVIAQAYPVDYYEEMEDVVTPVTLDAGIVTPNLGGRPGQRPEEIGFDLLDHTSDRIRFRLQRGTIEG